MKEATDKMGKVLDGDSRRRFLKGFSLLVGGSVAAKLLAGDAIYAAINYAPQADSVQKSGKVLSQTNLLTLRDICSQVIPKTDTDGAAEVDTHGFIDNQLFHCHSQADHQKALGIINKIENVAKTKHQKGFTGLSQTQQLELLKAVEAKDGFNDDDLAAFKFVKSMIVFGYYTSEVGATKELSYLMVPGPFKGSIPYDSVGKAWGAKSYY